MKKNRKNRKFFLVCALLIIGSFILINTALAAESPAEFYKNNKVTIIVPFGPGGGTDYAARIFATLWSDYTDGGVMRVKNMQGGGGVVAANYIMTAKPDGLTICVTEQGTGLMLPIIFKDPAAKYDPSKFEYFGAFAYTPSFMVVPKKSKIEKPADLFGASGLRFPAAGIKSDNALDSAIIADIFNMKDAKLIAGYESTAEMGLSMARGETN
ncbi:MAG: hypothetical protein ABIA63_02410, partial [bacterium]